MRIHASNVFWLSVFALLASAPAARALCVDGTIVSCRINGQPGHKECVNGHFGPCIPTCDAECCSNSACFSPANGHGVCSGGTCTISCNAGYKACDGSCIPTASCCSDTDCPAPSNGYGTCNNNGSCSWACNGGYKACGSSCIANSACCTNSDCPIPNGTLTCSANACSGPPVCAAGYKGCGNACIPNANCCVNADCPAVANGTQTCESGTCALHCNQGLLDCGGVCYQCCSTADCNPPVFASAICTNHQCAITCNQFFHATSDQRCIPDGTCAAASECPPPPSGHGAASCASATCGVACDAGYSKCGNDCVQACCQPTGD